MGKYSSQWDVFQCLDDFTIGSVFNAESYLQKGERIMSLVKDHKKVTLSHRDLFSCISRKMYEKNAGLSSVYYALKRIRCAYVPSIREKVLFSCLEQEENFGEPLLRLLHPAIRTFIQLRRTSNKEDELLAKGFFGQKCLEPLPIRIVTFGEYLTFLKGNLSEKRHMREWYPRSLGKKYATVCVDFDKYFADILLINEIFSYLWEHHDEGDENPVYASISGRLRVLIQKATENGILRVDKELVSLPDFAEFAKTYKLDYLGVSTGQYMTMNNLYLYLFLHGEFRKEMLKGSFLDSVFRAVFDIIYREYLKDVDTEKYLHNLSSERATVWQTKKNIPESVVNSMEKSSFNNYFGYVEFDEECELEKMDEIAQEFRALNTILNIHKNEGESLRFRKLGNHHASGLYFPSIHCLCVDIRTPSSMCHECFHMIDHMKGELSRKTSFQAVEYLYKDLVCKAVSKLPDDSPFKKRMKGSTKYNERYYFEPTEIFARCGEIYLTRVLNVSNSLCQPEASIVYPSDESLLIQIKEYFEHVLKEGESVL